MSRLGDQLDKLEELERQKHPDLMHTPTPWHWQVDEAGAFTISGRTMADGDIFTVEADENETENYAQIEADVKLAVAAVNVATNQRLSAAREGVVRALTEMVHWFGREAPEPTADALDAGKPQAARDRALAALTEMAAAEEGK